MRVVELKGPCTTIFVRKPVDGACQRRATRCRRATCDASDRAAFFHEEHYRLDRLRSRIKDEMQKELEEGKAAAARGFGPAGGGSGTAASTADASKAPGDPQEALLAAMVQRVTASVTASVNEIVAAHLLPLRAVLAGAQGQMLADVSTASRETRVLACKAYNAQCGEGTALPYMPVPNAAGAVRPTCENEPLTSDATLLELSAESAAKWCEHYGIAAPPALEDRRRAVAKQLGVSTATLD